MQHISARQRVVGQTKDVGFQIGVRGTFASRSQQVWEVMTSEAGVKLWLGDVSGLQLMEGAIYQTRDGVEGEIRVVNPGEHLRLTWRPQEWQKASTLQVRVIPKGEKAVISFHQEHLFGEQEREQMRQRWEKVLEELHTLLGNN